MQNKAVLLVNLGSPDKPDVPSVRRYLNQFLMDPFVIQLPWLLRRLIVGLFVLPFRPKASAHAYQSVWTEDGSPLLALSRKLLQAVQAKTTVPVRLAMRYGSPSIESELLALEKTGNIEEVLLLPLYPHYAESTVKTSIVEAERVIAEHGLKLKLTTLPVFYNHPDYIRALEASTRPWLELQDADHILFSYHGLPELHITKADPTGQHCLKVADCCKVASEAHATCYRHQVLKTTELFVAATGLKPEQYTITFQSRLGRAKWLEPSTENTLRELGAKGMKKVLVMCPAFVTDCLETLEEIEIQGSETFRQAGGEELVLIPCLNDHPAWVDVLTDWCEKPLRENV